MVGVVRITFSGFLFLFLAETNCPGWSTGLRRPAGRKTENMVNVRSPTEITIRSAPFAPVCLRPSAAQAAKQVSGGLVVAPSSPCQPWKDFFVFLFFLFGRAPPPSLGDAPRPMKCQSLPPAESFRPTPAAARRVQANLVRGRGGAITGRHPGGHRYCGRGVDPPPGQRKNPSLLSATAGKRIVFAAFAGGQGGRRTSPDS